MYNLLGRWKIENISEQTQIKIDATGGRLPGQTLKEQTGMRSSKNNISLFEGDIRDL